MFFVFPLFFKIQVTTFHSTVFLTINNHILLISFLTKKQSHLTYTVDSEINIFFSKLALVALTISFYNCINLSFSAMKNKLILILCKHFASKL